MTNVRFRTRPLATTEMPPGVFYLVANEGAERFSYYGMRAILVVFMTSMLLNVEGELDPMGEAEAKAYFHLFASAVYFFPFLGALLADVIWGKYRTIIVLSLVYCAGHAALAIDHTRIGLAVGLTLIAIGSGGIKPCVSANLGDQFSSANSHLLPRAFSWFYFAINIGAFGSILLTPWLLEHYGPGWAFGVPGVLMFLATSIFWMGRNAYAHIPPAGWDIINEFKHARSWRAIRNLCGIYLFVAFFWSLYDQMSSAWVLQAQRMDRQWMGVEWLPSQIQAVNPVFIMVLIPLFSYVVFPLCQRVVQVTPLRRIGTGLFIAVGAFALSAGIEHEIAQGEVPSIAWQILAFGVMTVAEILVAITCLEFSYTQAPLKLKSLVMGLFLLSVSLGNAFTSLVNFFIQRPDGTLILEGPDYYWFFAGVMFLVGCVFLVVSRWYREKTHLHSSF